MRHEVKIKSNYKIERQTYGSAGFDLRINEGVVISPNCCVTVGTGVSLDMSSSRYLYAEVFPRSSLGKTGIMLANTVGVIDNDYQGEIKLMLRNVGLEPVVLEYGMRIAQIIFKKFEVPMIRRVREFESETDRGEGGFGSTGLY